MKLQRKHSRRVKFWHNAVRMKIIQSPLTYGTNCNTIRLNETCPGCIDSVALGHTAKK